MKKLFVAFVALVMMLVASPAHALNTAVANSITSYSCPAKGMVFAVDSYCTHTYFGTTTAATILFRTDGPQRWSDLRKRKYSSGLSMHDNISTIYIARGQCGVTLYRDINYGGPAWYFPASQYSGRVYDLGPYFNDKASSLKAC